MVSLLIGVFACVVISAGAVSVLVDTKGEQQTLPESTEKQMIRKEDKASSVFTDLLGESTGARPAARASVVGGWKPRHRQGDDEAAMRQSTENTIRMRHSNAQKALASKRAGSNKTKREEPDDCANIFHNDPPNQGHGANCKEGENIKPGTSCTWDCEGASPQVSECKCEPKYGITVCELTPRQPVCAGMCAIGEGAPCKTRTIDHNKYVIGSGESCKWEDPVLCPGAVPAEAKCKCGSEPPGEFRVRPDCEIAYPKCKGTCEAVMEGHAKCKEADARDEILEGTQCTLECLESGKTADPKQSTCTCSEEIGGCVIVPSDITCASSWFGWLTR